VAALIRLRFDGEGHRWIYVGFFMHYQMVMPKKTFEGQH
jgi:hypothetical protein